VNGQRSGDWIITFRSVQFFPLDPRVEEIHLEDIAHSLSNQCRFAGHCKSFYSVAQHSVLVSRRVPVEHARWGLLHDAAEAYLVDLPRPIKRCSAMGDLYREIEARLMRAICERFGLPFGEPPEVKAIDNAMLMTEKRDVMPPSPVEWHCTDEKALPEIIVPWSPTEAEARFLGRASGLGIR
jgi:hypothetical protein